MTPVLFNSETRNKFVPDSQYPQKSTLNTLLIAPSEQNRANYFGKTVVLENWKKNESVWQTP